MYLDILLDKFRTASSLQCLFSHYLNIEVGRHGSNTVKRHIRLCLLCDIHDVEDEHFFVLICPIYLYFRKRFIMLYFHKVSKVLHIHTMFFLPKNIHECNGINNIYINIYFHKRPSVHKFVEMMQSSNKLTRIHLGKYVHEALYLRKSLVNEYSTLFFKK